MTSRSLFFNLLKEDGKRRLWSIALAFLVFFFTFPVKTALVLGEHMRRNGEYQYLASDLRNSLSFHNGWAAALFILLSLILGVSSFSYLHSRQKVDFYHGIPVNRKQLFWANYANGILIPAAVYGINLVLTLLVIAVNGYSPLEVLGTVLAGYLLLMLHYCMMYSVTVLAMILTGNIVVGILGTMVFQFYFPCMFLVLRLCFGQFFYTSYRNGGEAFSFWLDKSSPFMLFVYNLNLLNQETSATEWSVRIIAVLAVTVVFTFLSFLLYKKRGLEGAGKAMAFHISMPIIRNPIVVLSALWGSVFCWLLHSSIGWAVFGLICGSLLSHGVIEIIYHFDFRKLFSHWKQLVVSALLAAVVFCGFRYDLFGYDKYIPAESSLESVAVSMSDTSYWVPYGNPGRDEKGDYYWQYQDSDDYVLGRMKLTDTAPVLALVRDAVERNQKLNHGKDFTDSSGDTGRSYRFSVKYQMKNGKSIYRSYDLYSDQIRPELVKILENPNFVEAVYPILTQTPEDTAWVRVSRGEQTSVVSRDRNGTDKAMTEKLLLAYQEDFKNLKVETMEKENPIASIQFLTRLQAEAETKREAMQSSWQYSEVTSRGYYPIYPSFKKTLELLKECQVDTESWKGAGNVVEITIGADQFKDNKGYDTQFLTVTDRAQIEAIMAESAADEYSNMNPFGYLSGERISFSAVTEAGGSRNETRYSIPLEKLPEAVKSEIEKIKKDA